MYAEKLIYLCGPITGLSYEGSTEWRDTVRQYLNPHIRTLSPLRRHKHLEGFSQLADCYPEHALSTQKSITTLDRYDCTRSDLVIASFLGAQKISIGSMIELGWADSKRIPIILVMDLSNIHNHGMVREIANWQVENLEQAAMIANHLLTPE